MYATPDELAVHMGVPGGTWPTAAQEARATQMIEDATGVIDAALGGRSLAWSTDEVTLDGTGTDRLILPRWPVADVLSVVEIDAEGEEETLVYRDDYTWSESGILTRCGRWPCHDRAVRVQYTAGHQLIPSDVKRICRRLAAAGWENPSGHDQHQLGDRNVKWHTPGMELTTAEKDTLAQYGMRR